MKVFKSLALTANTKHWPQDDAIVMLGPWCQDFNADYIKDINYELMPSPYKHGDALKYYYSTLDIFERYLPILAKYLNEINKTNLQLRSWRIILGPWLIYYLAALRDRLLYINHALSLYESIKTVAMDQRDFVTPKDTYSSLILMKQDDFNFQIFSQIIHHSKVNTEVIRCKVNEELTIPKSDKMRVFRFLINKILLIMSKKIRPKFFFKNTYFPKSIEFLINLKFIGRVFSSIYVENTSKKNQINFEKRKIFLRLNSVDDQFEGILKNTLVYNLPLSFIECFHDTIEESKSAYPADIDVIISATSWYFDDAFKYWAACRAEKGSSLLGLQHGGGYGSYLTLAEYHELNVLDKYYSWGWAVSDSIICPMPANKLVNKLKRKSTSRKQKKILWVGTAINRFLFEYPFIPKFNNEYLDWQFRFYKSLDIALVGHVKHRPHHAGYTNNFISKLKRILPDLEIEEPGDKFMKSLLKTRIYVCDHNSTTFLEALALNIPTVLFWNPEHYELFEHARPFYQSLLDCGVLHYSPEGAAELVSKIYDNVDDWWFDNDRQDVIEKFCRNYALNNKEALRLWKRELESLAKADS